MRKKSLLALLLVLVMILSGCALNVVNEEKDSARVVVDVNGKTITKGQVAQAYSSEVEQYNNWVQYYQYYLNGQMDYSTYAFYCQYLLGVDPSQGMTQPTYESVIQEYVQLLAARDKAVELGFDKLTDDQIAQTKETAKQNYETFIKSVISENFADSELDDDAKFAEAEKFVAENPEKYADVTSTLEAFEQAALDAESTLDQAVYRMEESIINAVTVEEDELQAELEEHIAEAKAAYTVTDDAAAANQAALEEARTALTEAQEALNGAAADADKTALQAAVDAAQTKVQEAEQAIADAAEDAIAAYEQDLNNGQIMFYNLPGYRKISEILIPFTDVDQEANDAQSVLTEAQTALTAAQTALVAAAEDADKTELQAAVDEAQAKVNEAQEAYDAASALQRALTDAQTALTAAQTALEGAAEDADKTDLQAAVDEAQAKVDEAQAAVDARKAELKEADLAKAREVYEMALAEGADFDALIKEYNKDGTTDGIFYVSADSVSYVPEFVNAAMSVDAIGGISEPTESQYGYHIVKYLEDVPEGEVSLDSVRETLHDHLLSVKQQQAINDAFAEWVADADVKTYPEKMK